MSGPNYVSDSFGNSTNEEAPLVPRPGRNARTSVPRKYVTKACEPCRGVRAKCDGLHPCARCTARGSECVYRLEEDARSSRASLKRKLVDLQNDSDTLHHLLKFIKQSNDDDVAQIWSLIRNDASLETVHQCLVRLSSKAKFQQTPIMPELDDIRNSTELAIAESAESAESEKSSPSRPLRPLKSIRAVLGIDRLTDIPIHQVPASPWTQVVDDDHLVSHLISLWATWNYQWPQGVNLDLFLRDMRRKDINSPFCSPFLVNSILAYACPLSDYEEARTSQGRISNLATLFVNEAKSHLEKDLTTSITTIQGLLMLLYALSSMAQDAQGYYFCAQALAMRTELIRDRPKLLRSATSETERKELSYVLDYTIWGSFSAIALVYFGFHRYVHIPKFTRPFPDVLDNPISAQTQDWVSYPHTGKRGPSCQDLIMHHSKELALITRQATCVLYPDVNEEDFDVSRSQEDTLVTISIKLMAWKDDFLIRLTNTDTFPSPGVPIVLWLGSYVAMVTMTARLSCDVQGSGETAMLTATTAPDNMSGSVSNNLTVTLREQLVDLALEVVHNIEIYERSSMDLSRIHVLSATTFSLALNILIDAQNTWSLGNGRFDREIIKICSVMELMSRRIPWVANLFRTTKLDCRSRGIHLPAQAAALFEESEAQNCFLWKRKVPSSSAYSPFYLNQADRDVTMTEFIRKFDRLDV